MVFTAFNALSRRIFLAAASSAFHTGENPSKTQIVLHFVTFSQRATNAMIFAPMRWATVFTASTDITRQIDSGSRTIAVCLVESNSKLLENWEKDGGHVQDYLLDVAARFLHGVSERATPIFQ